MRKTRLVILPTKCLHQMGFLLLFLSCPVIGDWGRIRPESENSHKAIQVDREGTCALQRDPPGGLLDFAKENGSDQCRLSEDFYLNTITKKPIFREVRSDERRVDLQRNTQRRNVRDLERRQAISYRRDITRVDDRRNIQRESQRRVADEKRNIWKESERNLQRNFRENSITRSRSSEYRRYSTRQLENEQAVRRQRVVHTRNIQNDNDVKTRNTREGLRQTDRVVRNQNDRRLEKRSTRDAVNERRENDKRIRTAQETEQRQNSNRDRDDIRRDNRRFEQVRSLRKRETDMPIRHVRGRSLERQTERLSQARRVQNRETRNSESGRHVERSESREPQIRRTRSLENFGEANEHRNRETRSFDIRRNAKNVRLMSSKRTERDFRERRDVFLHDRTDTKPEDKSRRTSLATKYVNLVEDISLENKHAEDNVSGGVTKWMDFQKFENFKVGDWTTNCVIGAVVYFLSTKQIKAA